MSECKAGLCASTQEQAEELAVAMRRHVFAWAHQTEHGCWHVQAVA